MNNKKNSTASTHIIEQETDWVMLVPELLQLAAHRKKWCFYGDLGAGKTTLIKAIAAHLGVQDSVTSPTYSLINEYECIAPTTNEVSVVYHMDLYRLNSLEEALDIGIEDYLDNENYCFIEWPEVIDSILPLDCIKISIDIVKESKRKVVFL